MLDYHPYRRSPIPNIQTTSLTSASTLNIWVSPTLLLYPELRASFPDLVSTRELHPHNSASVPPLDIVPNSRASLPTLEDLPHHLSKTTNIQITRQHHPQHSGDHHLTHVCRSPATLREQASLRRAKPLQLADITVVTLIKLRWLM